MPTITAELLRECDNHHLQYLAKYNHGAEGNLLVEQELTRRRIREDHLELDPFNLPPFCGEDDCFPNV